MKRSGVRDALPAGGFIGSRRFIGAAAFFFPEHRSHFSGRVRTQACFGRIVFALKPASFDAQPGRFFASPDQAFGCLDFLPFRHTFSATLNHVFAENVAFMRARAGSPRRLCRRRGRRLSIGRGVPAAPTAACNPERQDRQRNTKPLHQASPSIQHLVEGRDRTRLLALPGHFGVGEPSPDGGAQDGLEAAVVASVAQVEREHALVQVAEQVEWLDTYVGAVQPTLEQAPEVLDPVRMDAPVYVALGVIDGRMGEVSLKAAIGVQRIGIDGCAGTFL